MDLQRRQTNKITYRKGENPTLNIYHNRKDLHMKKLLRWGISACLALLVACATPAMSETLKPKPTFTAGVTKAITKTLTPTHDMGANTFTQTPTATLTPTETRVPITVTSAITGTPTFTLTVPVATLSPTITATQGGYVLPYPTAPLCPNGNADDPDHNKALWHSLWDGARGCHYDHEHGQTPFTQEVRATFPQFDLARLLCGNEVSHCNPSSGMENTHKHGGNKWQVDLDAPQQCFEGFESGTIAVDAYAIQYHDFGMQSVEHETSTHSTVALLEQCKSDNPADKGYIFVGQLQQYGSRVMPYQGMTLPYPDKFDPLYDGRFGQYFTTECFGNDFSVTEFYPHFGTTVTKFIDCRDNNSYKTNLTIWTSKKTGRSGEPRLAGSTLFTLLFRGRDNYERFDPRDMVHPFTWKFVCGMDTYNPIGCSNNNSTATIHEIKGVIPTLWDNVAGWDTDSRIGRVSVDGFVTRYGTRNTTCLEATGLDCQPIKTISAFVGTYSSEISVNKVSNPTPVDTPERDIYFCGITVCSETSPNAVPSGWIGQNN